MFNRRGLLGGAAASAMIIAPPDLGKSTDLPVLKRFVINPHRQRYHNDAEVTLVDIVVAEFIRFGQNDGHKKNWFQVRTHDGRTIQSELFGRADRHRTLALMNEMRNLGCKIYVRNYA